MEKQLNMPQPPPTDHPADALWQKIEQFQLDDPTAALPFSKKLAKENNWNESFTRQATEEYRKFVYLCCTSPEGASPSYIVDQVWHLHLCYTVNYWEDFCEKTLQRKLHHHPSKGGPSEQKHHHDWNERTLRFYRRTFKQEPPAHIWQPTASPQKQSQGIQKSSNFFRKKQRILTILTLLLFPTLSSCKGEFSLLLLPVIALALVIIATNSAEKNKEANHSDSGGSSCGGGGCSSSSCGSSCGGGCGGCGGS